MDRSEVRTNDSKSLDIKILVVLLRGDDYMRFLRACDAIFSKSSSDLVLMGFRNEKTSAESKECSLDEMCRLIIRKSSLRVGQYTDPSLNWTGNRQLSWRGPSKCG